MTNQVSSQTPESVRQLLEDLSCRKKADVCRLDEILMWLRRNLSEVFEKLDAQLTRSLLATTDVNIRAYKEDSKAFFVCDFTWLTSADSRQPPDFSMLDQYISGFTLRPLFATPTHLTMRATFDLEQWPRLVPTILSEELRLAYYTPDLNDTTKLQYHNRASCLVQELYPDLTMDFLRTVGDLGFVQADTRIFASWLENHLASKNNKPVDLPRDFGSTFE